MLVLNLYVHGGIAEILTAEDFQTLKQSNFPSSKTSPNVSLLSIKLNRILSFKLQITYKDKVKV